MQKTAVLAQCEAVARARELRTLANLTSSLLHEQLHNHLGTISDGGSGAEDGGDAGFVQEVIVLCGDDTTCGDHDVGSAEFLEFLDDLRDKGLSSEAAIHD